MVTPKSKQAPSEAPVPNPSPDVEVEFTLLPQATSLAARMARVMGKLDRLPKSGFNTYHNYHFATADDVLDTLRPLLADEGIALIVSVPWDETVQEPILSGDQQKGWHTRIGLTIKIVADSGEYEIAQFTGESSDAGDKGIQKAATSGLKYWLLKTFMLSTGDVADESDASGDVQGQRQAVQPQRPAQPANGQVSMDKPSTLTYTCTRVEVRMTANNKRYYVALGDQGQKSSVWEREMFLSAGIDTTHRNWETVGVIALPSPVQITAKLQPNGYYNITNVTGVGAESKAPPADEQFPF